MRNLAKALLLVFMLNMLSACAVPFMIAGSALEVQLAASAVEKAFMGIAFWEAQVADGKDPYAKAPALYREKCIKNGMTKEEAQSKWTQIRENVRKQSAVQRTSSSIESGRQSVEVEPPNITLNLLYLKYWG